MVKKEGNIFANKKEVFIVVSLSFLFGLLVFVMAASTVNLPVAGGNYSGAFTINITVDANGKTNMTNITCYHNSSGENASTFLVGILNESDADLDFTTSIATASLADSTLYNISCSIYNSTTLNKTISVGNIIIDNTAPNVTFSGITNTINNGNYSATIVLNVSVVDSTIGIGAVYFNITDSSVTQHNFTKASTPGGGYYNITLDTTVFADGKYNITVWANDTQLGNLNNSEEIEITIDDTAPSVTFTCTPVSALAGELITCVCSGTDAASGIATTSFTVNPSSDTLGSHTETCTITDYSGYSASATATFSVESTSSSSSSSSSTSWTNTYTATDEEFVEGYTKELAVKNRVRIKVGGTNHYLGIKELTSTTATIEVSSTPQQANLAIGDERKFDVTADGYYDIYVKLNSISSNKANVTIKSIHEEITEETISVEEKKEAAVAGGGEGGEVETEGSKVWIWIVVIVVLLIIIGGGYGLKKKSRK